MADENMDYLKMPRKHFKETETKVLPSSKKSRDVFLNDHNNFFQDDKQLKTQVFTCTDVAATVNEEEDAEKACKVRDEDSSKFANWTEGFKEKVKKKNILQKLVNTAEKPDTAEQCQKRLYNAR